MKTILWWIVAGMGLAVMIEAYQVDRPADESAPFASGIVYVSKAGSPASAKPIPFPSTKARFRQLPLAAFPSIVVGSISATDAKRGRRIEFQLAENVFELSLKDAGITETALAWGRLPRTGQNEVIAGYRTLHRKEIDVAGQTLAVVGGLGRDAALLAGSYLVARGASPGRIFDSKDQAVRSAVLIPLTAAQLGEDRVREQLKARFPPEQFDSMSAVLYAERGPYLCYLFGLTLWCLGGSGGLIGLYAAAARRVRWRVLRDPLTELSTYRGLLWGVHLVYFGLYLLAALIVYQAPDVQKTLITVLQGQIRGGEGPLGVAGTAYATRNVPFAALVTFVINFFVGSAALLTLPSCVIPGSGAVVAMGRALLWGVVLAPTSRLLARTMLPHSGTLLLEGEGYILATFFGLLIPIYLFRSNRGPNLVARYRQGVAVNLKGNLLVALILVVAALYEATEVILQAR
ncbi:MAG TPA: hypothetical protein VMR25_15125 [Planctomycetaceae bacterium]|jgi:hypothetical protein|nr:hypothetical protein [Planctomycetaceae bacterium]